MTITDPGPSSLPRKPDASVVPTTASDWSTSQTPNTCALCSNPSKYTCPRCSVKTCSLDCSKSHKASTGCTGERDRAAYVPMNTYTWGTLADDYVFLEDVGRKATGWGRDIVSTGRGRGGKRGGRAGRGTLSPKCETLRVQLAARDIGISFVAEGMEKRRLSQSLWDVRTKTAYLTVEFVFHIKYSDQKVGKTAPVMLLTHRNDLAVPLATSLISHLKRKSDVPPSVLELIGLLDDPSKKFPALPSCLFLAISQLERPKPGEVPAQYQAPALPIRMTQRQSSFSIPSHAPDPSLKPRKVFYPINPNDSLQACLRHRSFVEWPTIDVFPSRQIFVEGKHGVLRDGANESVMPPGDQPSNKRRRTDTGMVQLVGEYGEESGSDIENTLSKETGVLGICGLGDYASDDGEAGEVEEGL